MTDLKPDDLEPLRDISKDGPHLPSDHRRWLARKPMDSKLSDAEAYGIVAHSPDVSAAYGSRAPIRAENGELAARVKRWEEAALPFAELWNDGGIDWSDPIEKWIGPATFAALAALLKESTPSNHQQGPGSDQGGEK